MPFYLLLVFVIVSSHVHADDAVSWSRTNRQASAFIIRLVPTCPSSTTPGSVGKLELQADVPSEAQAYCKNGNITFSSVNKPIYELDVVLSNPTGNQCQFFKKVNVSVYTAHVIYGWGDPDSPIFTSTKHELVTCSYNGYGNIETSVHQIQEFPLAPVERAYYLGNRTVLPVTLSVINILDQIIDGRDIIVGRTIRLRATVDANFNQTVKAVSCSAQNSAGVNHAVLSGGCGDGLIFSKDSGFTTEGVNVYSPYFKTFKLKGASDLKFNCTFIVCSGNCDGSSCTVLRRRKREIASVSTYVLVHNPGPPMVEAIAMILVHERLRYITISTGLSAASAGKATKPKPQPISQIKVISFEKLNIVNQKGDEIKTVSKVKSSKIPALVNNNELSPSRIDPAREPKQKVKARFPSKVPRQLVEKLNPTGTVAINESSFVILPDLIPKKKDPESGVLFKGQTAGDDLQYASPNIYVDEIKVELSGSDGSVLSEDAVDVLRLSSDMIILDSAEEKGMQPIGVEDNNEKVDFGAGTMRIISGPQPEDGKTDINNEMLLINEPGLGQRVVPAAFSVNSFTFFVAMTICSLIVVILLSSGMYLCRGGRAMKNNKLDIAIITTAQDINKITKDFEDVTIDKMDIVCDCKPDVTSHATITPPPQPSDTYIIEGTAHC